jgi:hypothetical protein
MCLGVARRGVLDEEDWFGQREEFWKSYEDDEQDNNDNQNKTEVLGPGEHRSLVYWYGKHLMATRCSNEGAVIEWVLVPFIVEDGESGSVSNVESDDEEL